MWYICIKMSEEDSAFVIYFCYVVYLHYPKFPKMFKPTEIRFIRGTGALHFIETSPVTITSRRVWGTEEGSQWMSLTCNCITLPHMFTFLPDRISSARWLFNNEKTVIHIIQSYLSLLFGFDSSGRNHNCASNKTFGSEKYVVCMGK